MDAAQWPQGIGVVKSIDQALKVVGGNEKKPRPPKEHAINCPRCNSTNTKFCYYNNYSLTQPRYFCKTCRRYWTNGGTLRSVPVGGGSRKNKRSSTTSSLSSSSSPSKKPTLDLSAPTQPTFSHPHHQNPKLIIHGAQDLNLSYNPPPSSDHFSSFSNLLALQQKPMDFLKNSGIGIGRGLDSFMQLPPDCSNSIYSSSSSGLPLHDFKPTLNFSLDGFENNGYGNLDNHQGGGEDQETNNNAKLFFPMEDLKQVSNINGDQFDHHQQQQINRGQGGDHNQANGYWNGMLGGGSW